MSRAEPPSARNLRATYCELRTSCVAPPCTLNSPLGRKNTPESRIRPPPPTSWDPPASVQRARSSKSLQSAQVAREEVVLGAVQSVDPPIESRPLQVTVSLGAVPLVAGRHPPAT